MSVKDILKRILPPPVHVFNREISRVLEAIEEDKAQKFQMEEQLRDENATMLKLLRTLQAEQNQHLNTLEERLQEQSRLIASLQEVENQNFTKTRDEIQTKFKDISKNLERTRQQSIEARRHASEAVWAQIFNNTIINSTWLKDKTFSPGRWAVGYPYLYVMYRVLNEMRPKRILELGLGQSTRMIAQYAAAYDNVEHIVVEHDPEWIKFFCNDFSMSDSSRIVQLDLEMRPYKDADAVRTYRNFKQTFEGQKFDFISVDAPLGGDMIQYARIDVLNLIPGGLSENFIIAVDDCNRVGESNTVKEIQQSLTEHQIDYRVGWYSGEKSNVLICPSHMGFLCSM